MPYCFIAENPAEDAAMHRRMVEELQRTGPPLAQGQRLLIAGPADPGWRVISVWDSREAHQRFFEERLRPAVQQVGCPIEQATMALFEVHTLLAGDLVGAPQPV